MLNSLIKYKDLPLKVTYYSKKRQIETKIFFATSKFKDILEYFDKNLKEPQTFLKSSYFLNGKQIYPTDTLLYFATLDPNLCLVEQDMFVEIEELEHLDDSSEPIYEKLLKPVIDPFKLIILNIKEGILQQADFPKEKIEEFGFDTLNNNFACCNSTDALYISCGKNFWIIAHNNFQIEKKEMPFFKEKHSMTYILSNNTIFIAGGSEESFYYDINSKEFITWGKMNGVKDQPGLIQYGDYLYSFNSFNTKAIYFERTKLTNPAKKWEKIIPQSGDQESGFFYNQLYGVSKCSGGNIIFAGGVNNQLRTFIYNIKLNVLFINYNKDESIILNERTFYKIDHNFNIAIPKNIEKDHIISILNKNSKTLHLIPFEQIGAQTRNNLLRIDNPRDRLPGNIIIQCRYMTSSDFEKYIKQKEIEKNNINNNKTKGLFDFYHKKEQGKRFGDNLNAESYRFQNRGKTPALERITEGKSDEENDDDEVVKNRSNSAKKEKRPFDFDLDDIGKFNFFKDKKEEDKKEEDKKDGNKMENTNKSNNIGIIKVEDKEKDDSINSLEEKNINLNINKNKNEEENNENNIEKTEKNVIISEEKNKAIIDDKREEKEEEEKEDKQNILTIDKEKENINNEENIVIKEKENINNEENIINIDKEKENNKEEFKIVVNMDKEKEIYPNKLGVIIDKNKEKEKYSNKEEVIIDKNKEKKKYSNKEEVIIDKNKEKQKYSNKEEVIIDKKKEKQKYSNKEEVIIDKKNEKENHNKEEKIKEIEKKIYSNKEETTIEIKNEKINLNINKNKKVEEKKNILSEKNKLSAPNSLANDNDIIHKKYNSIINIQNNNTKNNNINYKIKKDSNDKTNNNRKEKNNINVKNKNETEKNSINIHNVNININNNMFTKEGYQQVNNNINNISRGNANNISKDINIKKNNNQDKNVYYAKNNSSNYRYNINNTNNQQIKNNNITNDQEIFNNLQKYYNIPNLKNSNSTKRDITNNRGNNNRDKNNRDKNNNRYNKNMDKNDRNNSKDNNNNIIHKSNTSFMAKMKVYQTMNNNPFIDNDKYQNIVEKDIYYSREDSEPNPNKILINSHIKTIKEIKKSQKKYKFTINQKSPIDQVLSQNSNIKIKQTNSYFNDKINDNNNFADNKNNSYKLSTHKQTDKNQYITLSYNNHNRNKKNNLTNQDSNNINFSETKKKKKNQYYEQKINLFKTEENKSSQNFGEMYSKLNKYQKFYNKDKRMNKTPDNLNNYHLGSNSQKVMKPIFNNQLNFLNEKNVKKNIIIKNNNNINNNEVIVKDGKRYYLEKIVQRVRRPEDDKI